MSHIALLSVSVTFIQCLDSSVGRALVYEFQVQIPAMHGSGRWRFNSLMRQHSNISFVCVKLVSADKEKAVNK